MASTPEQPHAGSLVASGDQNGSPSPTVTLDNLPDEVLLEIFDHYRQSFWPHKFPLRTWNNKNGWFKLVHVCHKWRCIVLASRHRLGLRLFFTENTPTRAGVLESQPLSHLPIFVDYSRIVWNNSAQTRLISALRYSDRVVRIAINGPRKDFDKICKALDLPFPALVGLDLRNMEGNVEPIFLASSFMTSIKSLLYLWLTNVQLSSFLPLLSVTRALVFLNLTVDTLFCQTGGASLLTHLRHMSHLREIQVFTHPLLSNPKEKPPITAVLLTELSYLHFTGQCNEIEWFMAGLITPSLRVLRVSVTESLPTLHIPRLSKFIHVAGIVFQAARLSFLNFRLTTSVFAKTHSTNDLARIGIATFRTPSQAHLGSALSLMLATVDDVFLCISIPFTLHGPLLRDPVHWRKFFEEFRNVKVLRLHHGLEGGVAVMLRRPTVAQVEGDPDATTPPGPTINSNRSIFALDIFPLLEKIVVYPRTSNGIGEGELLSALEPFKEYAIARQQVGRPVEVLWDTIRELPRVYTLPDVSA